VHVDLPDEAYTLTQEEGAASGEVNQIGVQQDLDQSPEEPKAIVESEEGKHRSHITFLIKSSYPLLFSIYVYFVHLSCRGCLKP
jgi:hypothetical protein